MILPIFSQNLVYFIGGASEIFYYPYTHLPNKESEAAQHILMEFVVYCYGNFNSRTRSRYNCDDDDDDVDDDDDDDDDVNGVDIRHSAHDVHRSLDST